MSLGDQTVGFVSVSKSGTAGYLGLKTETRSLTLVNGCQFQPLGGMSGGSTETPDAQTDVATITWIFTGPPVAAVLAAKSTDELVYDGTDDPTDIEANRYPIFGQVQPQHDFSGAVDHVVITCKKQVG